MPPHPLFLEATASEQVALEKFISCPSKANWESLVKASKNCKAKATNDGIETISVAAAMPIPYDEGEISSGIEEKMTMPNYAQKTGSISDNNIIDGSTKLNNQSGRGKSILLVPTSEEMKVMAHADFSLFDIEMMDDDELYNGIRNAPQQNSNSRDNIDISDVEMMDVPKVEDNDNDHNDTNKQTSTRNVSFPSTDNGAGSKLSSSSAVPPLSSRRDLFPNFDDIAIPSGEGEAC